MKTKRFKLRSLRSLRIHGVFALKLSLNVCSYFLHGDSLPDGRQAARGTVLR